MKKLNKTEGTVTTGWLVAYLVCGFGPSFWIIVIPGVFAFFGCRLAPHNTRTSPPMRNALIIAAIVAAMAIWCYVNQNLELAIMLGMISAGSAAGILGRHRISGRTSYPGTLLLVLLATLVLTADAISRKSMLGTRTTLAVVVIGVLSVVCGVWWLRVREATKAHTLRHSPRE